MGLTDKCPFCGGKDCKIDKTMVNNRFDLHCEKGFECTLYNSIWLESDGRETKKRFHQMYLLLKESPHIYMNGIKYNYHFYYHAELSDSDINTPYNINVAALMKSYPKTFMDKMEKALYNLSKVYPIYGYNFGENFEMTHLFYCEGVEYEEYATEVSGILKILCELGYLSTVNLSENVYCITAKGWEKVSEMEKTESNNQGFIAMSFRNETKIISETFKKAISKCGYIPRRIKVFDNGIMQSKKFRFSSVS